VDLSPVFDWLAITFVLAFACFAALLAWLTRLDRRS
jgi:hypothetical protein